MASKFAEPGGDADFAVGTTNGFWIATSSSVIATDFVHGGHLKSIRHAPSGGGNNKVATASGTISDTGGKVTFFLYIVALPTGGTTSFVSLVSGSSIVACLRLTTAGIVQLWKANSAQIGSNGATLSVGQWYQIVLDWTIASTTVNRFEAYIYDDNRNAQTGISVTNATLTINATDKVWIGNTNGDASMDLRTSDHYINDSTDLAYPGFIMCTAKRPFSNGTANEFTTQVGASGSGYGSGHAPQVNERAISATNAWSFSNTTKKTEEYTIESRSQGDIDITNAQIIDYMGWMSAKIASTSNSPVHHIIVGGVATAKTLATTDAMYTAWAGSTTYPAGNTDIGIDAQYTSTPHLTTLEECGIIVVYIPGITTTKTVTGRGRVQKATTQTINGVANIAGGVVVSPLTLAGRKV